MAKKLTFAEFRSFVEQRRIPFDKLADYVEFEPNSAVPRLRFRSDALVDPPPANYDVDKEVYRMQRAHNDETAEELETFSIIAKKSVVAEGDSWFNLPPVIRPPTIPYWIQQNRRLNVKNIAYWGHTIESILKEREYMTAILDCKPDFFMFSAGGNDLQEGLQAGHYIHSYEPDRPVGTYLTDRGEAAISRIGECYRGLSAEVLERFPSLRIIYYGYDYARPLVGDGRYIGQYLRKQGIPDDLMMPIMVSVLNKLNEAIQQATGAFPNIFFLDCRRMTEPYTWYDDMHPSWEGFRILGLEFEQVMTRL